MNSEKNQIAVIGEALIDLIENETAAYEPHVGGSPFNFARATAKMGIDCHYLSPISTDEMGKKIVSLANESGILLPKENFSPKATSLALVYKNDKGLPDYNLYRSNVADLDIDQKSILDILPSHLAIFHTGSLAMVPIMENTLQSIIREVKSRGTKISIDVNIRLRGHESIEDYYSTVKNLMSQADFLKISDEDLEFLYGKVDPTEFCQTFIKQHGTSLIALTCGAEGAVLFNDNNKSVVPPILSGQYIDTVGAGDTFLAALISRMVEMENLNNAKSLTENELSKLGLYASIAAGINVCRRGCQPPTANEILSVAQQNGVSV